MRKVTIKLNFKSRLECFVIGWRYTRKFPTYSLRKALRELFLPEEMEVLIK